MLVESVGVSVVVAKIRKGKFSNLKDATIEKWYLFVAAFLIEFLVGTLNKNGIHFVKDNIFYIMLFSYTLLFIGLYFNRKNNAFKIIALGILLNFIVIMSNGGKMPVSTDVLMRPENINGYEMLKNDASATHVMLTEKTRFSFLADIIPMTKPYPLPNIFSVGDLFMALGVFLYIQEIMVVRKKVG